MESNRERYEREQAEAEAVPPHLEQLARRLQSLDGYLDANAFMRQLDALIDEKIAKALADRDGK